MMQLGLEHLWPHVFLCVCVSHLQREVVLQAGGDVQQRGAGLTCAEHELHMPGDRGRRCRQVVPLQQAVTKETLRAGHNYGKKRREEKDDKSLFNIKKE